MASTRTRATRTTRAAARPGKALLAHDRGLARYVAGADEAGRGALAGPLVAAAVVLDTSRIVGPLAAALGRLDDSKRLTRSVREELLDVVRARAQEVTVVVTQAVTIDRRGLHVSNIQAMRDALGALAGDVDCVLVDGFDIGAVHRRDGSALPRPRAVVKGDRTSAAIAAASIVAKVTRDSLMEALDAETGGYWAFAEHCGYATPLHAERIALHGTTPYHRMSYAAQSYEGAPLAQLPPLGTRTLHAIQNASAT